ncbi:hypothetical protein L6164_030978 [Bauhinia variegata]|uniref:Uncharacterized protein n=1 Tax=Bauhinia variegata TaxID=167791 RepID=A0ACB9LDM5_BAUVA|nr:hypothetical protein L6164_030978 [Bauhinia variegata]
MCHPNFCELVFQLLYEAYRYFRGGSSNCCPAIWQAHGHNSSIGKDSSPLDEEVVFNPAPFNKKEHVLITQQRRYLKIKRLLLQFPMKSDRFLINDNALYEDEKIPKGGYSGLQFFFLVFVSNFAYYIIPGYLFPSIASISVVCLIWKNSVTAQQIGSGNMGLGVGSFSLDWNTTAGFLGSPLVVPSHVTVNVLVGFALFVDIIMPIAYWTDAYDAKKFPLFSSRKFDSTGAKYNVTRILNEKTFDINLESYNNYSKLYLSPWLAFGYGLSFATSTSTLTHVALFHGKEIFSMWRETKDSLADQLERFACEGFWLTTPATMVGILSFFSNCLVFTLPIGIIQATTNQHVTRPLVCWRLQTRPLQENPPRAMFIVQLAGTLVASTTYFGAAWWLLTSIEQICDPALLPEGSPWTCPGDDVFYHASIIWGVIGPHRMFGNQGLYSEMNWFFLIGIVAPIEVWLLARKFPSQKWIELINMPTISSATAGMPPTKSVYFISWGAVGLFFNFYVYRKLKGWWARYNYVRSGALQAGVAFTALLLFFALQSYDIIGPNRWGLENDDHCPLAKCPTAPGIRAKGCPTL